VLGFKDNGHPSSADFPEYAVMGDGLADHSTKYTSCGCKMGKLRPLQRRSARASQPSADIHQASVPAVLSSWSLIRTRCGMASERLVLYDQTSRDHQSRTLVNAKDPLLLAAQLGPSPQTPGGIRDIVLRSEDCRRCLALAEWDA